MEREQGLGRKILKGSVITEIFYSLFAGVFDALEGTVESFIQKQQKRIIKQLSIIAVFFTGAVFLLNSLALFISNYLEKSPWVGYGVVGGYWSC